ncbi:methyltransferase domain-containing protein [Paenibacillus lutrae]|uniref:Malonyl-[acyl-carrier protein] O-methyltransferase n=1 Tax=Paenibacillus lutrae TaxID=2078573 RepID=A0A7X3FEU0_9BACL|nr:methyltransferase domain-containing protein [Paenibacillus lutrae]MVO98380.1 methyltransferase domain-containing protein [Paenibacillus lutrae]
MSAANNTVARRFDRSAEGPYDVHARVQSVMAKRLADSVTLMTDKSDMGELRILEIGCGTGSLTEILNEKWPCSCITAVDVSPAMIKAAERRMLRTAGDDSLRSGSRRDSLRFVQADIEMWTKHAPAGSFDLILSNACFQWLRDPAATLRYLQRLLSPGGLLAFATFGPDTFRELHQSFERAYRTIGRTPQRHGLSFQTREDWLSQMRAAGLSEIRSERSDYMDEHPSPRDFLLSVKALGASSSEAEVPGVTLSRQLFTAMFRHYENHFGIPGGVSATYDLLFFQGSTVPGRV